MNVPNPGFTDQARKRTTLRVVGAVLLAVGLVVAVMGVRQFLASMDAMDVDDNSGAYAVVKAAVGGFLAVFGIGALNAGFLGASARYTAGETMPVVKDSAAYLTDGQGVAGIGRTADDRAAATGPYCRQCGVRNDAEARFCDSCGASLG